MTELVQRCGRFGKFSLVGALGSVIQVVLFDFLTKLVHVPKVAAAPVAVEIVLLNNFLWHECFTWHDRGSGGFRRSAIRLWWFHVTNGVLSLAGNTALVYLLVERLGAPALPSVIAAIACCAPANFLLADRCVYRKEH